MIPMYIPIAADDISKRQPVKFRVDGGNTTHTAYPSAPIWYLTFPAIFPLTVVAWEEPVTNSLNPSGYVFS
jgi:hypothetical protein